MITHLSTLAARNLILEHELKTILAACEAQQLPCVPLRGPILASQLYHRGIVRPMGDLDLLVPREDLGRVKALCQALGYRLVDRRPNFAREFSYTFEMVKSAPYQIILEPHWSLAYPPFVNRLDMRGVWQRCDARPWQGVDVLRLSHEDLLLHLCLHLVHRGESAPLLWSYELHRLVAEHPLDAPRLCAVAAQAGLTDLIARALNHVAGLFGTPLPEPLHQRTEEDIKSCGSSESLAAFMTITGVRKKWRYIRGLAFPSSEFMRIHYHVTSRRQVGVWYLRRMLWLVVETIRGLAHYASGNLTRRSASGG